MILVEEHQIRRNHKFWKECDDLCFMSKNLYNACLYKINQFHNENGSYKSGDYWVFSNANLYQAMKTSPDFRTETHTENPKKINTKCLKQVYFQVNEVFSSHFKATKSYFKDKTKFLGQPRPPRYKAKQTGRNVFCFPKEALSFKTKDHISLSMTDIKIQTKLTKEKIKEVNIVPGTNCYKILISYEYQDTHIPSEHDKTAAIDLGVNNLMTLSSNDIGTRPIIINGRPVKSINQFYNKELAKKKSELPTKTFSSNAIRILTRKRNNKIKNYLHNATTYVVDYLLVQGITCLIVGKNDGWKQNVNMKNINNQNFVQIPFNMIINQLKYKCNKFGIEFILTNEAYTSKCSFLDLEPVAKQENYLGKRTKRGLFISSNGVRINADLNGSLNILRKVTGIDHFNNSVEAFAVMPKRCTVNRASLKQNCLKQSIL